MKIGLCWYQKSNESKCTYDLTNRMMVHLDIIFALASIARVPWFRLLQVTSYDETQFNIFLIGK